MKKLFLFLCLGLSVLFVGCSNETITNNNDVEETAEETTELSEEEYQASFNEFGKVYVTYTDTLNSYMQTIINSYSSDDLLTSYNNIKTIRDSALIFPVSASPFLLCYIFLPFFFI